MSQSASTSAAPTFSSLAPAPPPAPMSGSFLDVPVQHRSAEFFRAAGLARRRRRRTIFVSVPAPEERWEKSAAAVLVGRRRGAPALAVDVEGMWIFDCFVWSLLIVGERLTIN